MRFLRRPGHESLRAEDQQLPQLPHCDGAILHAPGACDFCDRHPDWQELRKVWRINFTGRSEANKAPCPSTYTRTDEQRDAWPGNRARGYVTPN